MQGTTSGSGRPTGDKPAIRPAAGRLGILTPGLGAVATTFMAGVESIRRGHSKPIGSLTQMATIRLGKRTENRSPLIKDFVPLAGLDDIVFGAWDPIPDDALHRRAEGRRARGEAISRPSPISSRRSSRCPPCSTTTTSRASTARTSRRGRRSAISPSSCGRTFATSRRRTSAIASSSCGARPPRSSSSPARSTRRSSSSRRRWRTTTRRSRRRCSTPTPRSWKACRTANGAPNLAVDIPALMQLANDKGVPISGKDFKTGQTWMKTVIAPGLKARMLGLAGWYSTNILGNRDGEVLDDPASFKTKEESKLSVLHTSCSRRSIPTCTRISRTWCGSTTTRRAATTRKGGTTSTSSGGWATRCRSRSTSSAAIPFSPRRSCSISRCSSTSRIAPA